jgi:predicted branched-subunit amino acid permease
MKFSLPHAHTFRAAFATSLPVLFGYLSIGFAYGFLMVKAGFAWFWAPVSGILIFAGAAQFLSIGMLASGRSIGEMFLAVLLINARHMVYGFSLLERFRAFSPVPGLPDIRAHRRNLRPAHHRGTADRRRRRSLRCPGHGAESVLLGQRQHHGSAVRQRPCLGRPGIEFSMTALFTVLLVEQIRSLRRPGPFLIALGVCVALYLVGLKEQSLLLGIVLSAIGVFFLPRKGAGDA